MSTSHLEEQAGVTDYFCRIHPYMKGKLTVVSLWPVGHRLPLVAPATPREGKGTPNQPSLGGCSTQNRPTPGVWRISCETLISSKARSDIES